MIIYVCMYVKGTVTSAVTREVLVNLGTSITYVETPKTWLGADNQQDLEINDDGKPSIVFAPRDTEPQGRTRCFSEENR